jgi:type I restriction enzyme S subunit
MSNNWPELSFGEFATLQRGADLPVQDRRPGPYPILASNGVVGSHECSFAVGPGVVTGRSGTIGKASFITGDYWPLNTVLWVSDFHGNDPRFVYFYFHHFDFRSYASGTGVPTLNRNSVHSVPVRIPPKHEQQKIAAVLWKIQRAIEVEEKLIATTRELKHAAMRQLFTRGLRREASKETEIGPIPQSWESVQLGRHLKLAQYGLSVRGREAGRYPILRMNCQLDGRVVFRDLQFVDLDAKVSGAFRVNDGDLLFNRTNSFELVGRTAIFRSEREAVFASYLIRLALDPAEFHPEFVNHYFNQPSVQADLKRLASRGVSQSNISASKLKEYPVPKTSLVEQREIAGAIDTVDRTVSVHERKRATLQELFKTVLHQLMTGQIRVDKLHIDVSEVRT